MTSINTPETLLGVPDAPRPRCDECGKMIPRKRTARRIWRTPNDALPMGLACSGFCASRFLNKLNAREAVSNG